MPNVGVATLDTAVLVVFRHMAKVLERVLLMVTPTLTGLGGYQVMRSDAPMLYSLLMAVTNVISGERAR